MPLETMIFRKSIADFVNKIIDHPEKYFRESYGISKPGTDDKLDEIKKLQKEYKKSPKYF